MELLFFKFIDQCRTPDLPAQNNLAVKIKANKVKHVLADIDAD
jgi:hypothetical protein